MDFYQYDSHLRNNLQSSEERVYRAIMSFKNNNDCFAFPSQEKLAEKANISLSTVKRTIKSLANKGFIVIEKMKRKLGHYNKYFLKFIPTFDKKVEQTTEVEDTFEVDNFEEREENHDFSEAIIAKTKITKMTDKQKADINSFNKVSILQVLGSKKGKKAKTATFFIDLLISEAIGNGSIKQHQIKKFNVLMPKS